MQHAGLKATSSLRWLCRCCRVLEAVDLTNAALLLRGAYILVLPPATGWLDGVLVSLGIGFHQQDRLCMRTMLCCQVMHGDRGGCFTAGMGVAARHLQRISLVVCVLFTVRALMRPCGSPCIVLCSLHIQKIDEGCSCCHRLAVIAGSSTACVRRCRRCFHTYVHS